jgi:hypothetical protein
MAANGVGPALLAGTGYVRLRPHLQVVRDGRDVVIAGDGAYRLAGLSAEMQSALSELQAPGGFDCARLPADAHADVLVQALHERRLVHWSQQPFSSTPEQGTRAYVASLVGNAEALEALARRRVMVVGCGGLGGELARHLVASGVRRLLLVDGDVVSKANLNRQYLFTHAQVGQPKVEAARSALLALEPEASIDVARSFVRDKADLAALEAGPVDVVACCADTPLATIFDLLARYAIEQNAIFATAGVGVEQGSWGPLMLPTHRPAYDDWRRQRSLGEVASAIHPPAASFGPTNSFVAAALAADLIHLLLGMSPPSLHCRVYFDFHTLGIERRPIVEQVAT